MASVLPLSSATGGREFQDAGEDQVRQHPAIVGDRHHGALVGGQGRGRVPEARRGPLRLDVSV